MAIKDTDRKARANYKKKITTIRMELYGTDEDIRKHIERVKEEGISVQGYIKDLIRADMNIKDLIRAELDKAALSADLKRFKKKLDEDKKKLDEERMEELKKGNFVSEEKRKEFQDRLDAGAKPADLFRPTKEQKQAVLDEMVEVMGRAEREGNFLRAKAMMKSHEKWKAAHSRKKDGSGDK